MIGALIILAFVAAVGLLLWIFDRSSRTKGGNEAIEESSEPTASAADDAGECCGLHIECEKTRLQVIDNDVVYYDDEELDRFAGIASADYTPEQEDEFEQVLLTMRAADIAGWSRSLQLRGIELPDKVRDELLLIVGEARQRAADRVKD